MFSASPEREVDRKLSSIVVKRLIVVKRFNKPWEMKEIGRGGGDRTHDLRLKRPLLYH